MIDLHCHLDLYPDPKSIVDRCRQECIFVLSVTTTPSAYRGTKALSCDSALIHTALGLHPQLAAVRKGELALFDSLLAEVRWVGEIGLDGAPEFRSSWSAQEAVFRHILATCSKAGGRILSIHSRHAAAAVLGELRKHPSVGIAVMHWFTGTFAELNQSIEQGCWFSIGLPMVRSKRGRAIIERLPRDRVLTESDGPFTQNGDEPSYPWDARETQAELSKIWEQSVGDTDNLLRENLLHLLKSA